MELWGARNQQPYQLQLHCFPPFHSALGNLRKTGASSNLHWRSERCHNWACFPRWVGGRAKKDETKWSVEKAPVLPKLMRTGGPCCPVACLWNSYFKASCRIVKMLSSLPFSLMEGKRLVSNKSVVCMTASWSECDQRVHEEYGKRRQTWYYCKEFHQPFSVEDNCKKAEESRSKQQRHYCNNWS